MRLKVEKLARTSDPNGKPTPTDFKY